MIRGAAGRRAFRHALLAFAGLGAASAAQAVELAGQETGERTGPQATPPPLPPYARPEETPPSIIPDPAQPPAPAADAAGSGVITNVRVSADGDGVGAVPPRSWQPPDDTISGLRLRHRAGQALDADWVREQFAANLPPEGGAVSSAVALVQLINRAFLTAGFVNSGLVVDDRGALAAGMLDLRLVYGRLATATGDPVVIEWRDGRSAGLDETYVRNRFPSARGQPLSAFDIERDFRLLAEDPAIRTVSADLRPSDRRGEAALRLLIYPDERVALYVGVANDRSPSVGGERLYAGGFARNLLAAGDLLTAEGGTTRGLEDAQLGYAIPLAPRTALSVRGSLNNAAVIDRPLLPLDISAKDRSAQVAVTHRFIDRPLTPRAGGGWSPSETLAGGLILAYRHQKSFLLGVPFSFAPGSVDGRTEYKAARLTGDYLLRNVDQVLAISVTATLGLGGTQSDIPTIPNPDDNFKVLLVQVNYARRLNTGGLELRTRLTGQIADGILYSGERLSIGGEGSVRGYRENLFLVDNGLTGTIELALPFSLSRQGSRTAAVDWGAITASVFADAAVFGNAEPPGPGYNFISAVGVGLAWNPSDAIQANVSWGVDLNRVVISGTRNIQDRGLQFRLVIHPLRLFRR